MISALVSSILRAPATALVGRLLLVFMFLGSGISKLLDFHGAQVEMAQFGLEPAWLYAAATVATQLAGSVLILLNRATWLGAGALAIFTLLTIPIVHHFWTMDGAQGQMEFYVAIEHLAVVGGMILAAVLAERDRAG